MERCAASVVAPRRVRQGYFFHRSGRNPVLRCIIDDADPDGEVTIHIDDKELPLAEFGRLLRVHAGCGMRIAFVPGEFISENRTVEIRKPKRRKR
jgi:hypothetical protein